MNNPPETLPLFCAACEKITLHTKAPKPGRKNMVLGVVMSVLTMGLWRITGAFKKKKPPVCNECGMPYNKKLSEATIRQLAATQKISEDEAQEW